MENAEALHRLKLAAPVRDVEKGGDAKVTELVFQRRPKARDFKGMGGTLTHDENILMLARVTNVSPAIIEDLDGADYLDALEVLRGFLSSGPMTGKSG